MRQILPRITPLSVSNSLTTDTTHRSYDPPPGPRTHGPGTPSGRVRGACPEGRGNTPTCPPTPTSYRDGLRSLGRRWTLSTKKTSASWAILLTATTASTSAKPPAASWFGIVTALSPIPGDR